MDVKDKLMTAMKHSTDAVVPGYGAVRQTPLFSPSRSPTTKPFVVKKDGQLFLDDGTPFRFASLNAPELLHNHDFEVEDTMRTFAGFGRRVTRTYALEIKGTSRWIKHGHISGWDAAKKDWIYDEAKFQRMDYMLAMADKYDVRVIVPIINADFGAAENNWVRRSQCLSAIIFIAERRATLAGNWVDLIIYRKNQGWNYKTAQKEVDFYMDREMIDSFKQLITYLLNRVNTVSGKRYGDDPTILAWQTGNELQYNRNGNYAPPGSWTAEIAKHIKSLAPRTLVMDGTFAINDNVQESYALEALECKDVDLIDPHYYKSSDISGRFEEEMTLARKHDKILIIAEYGFFDTLDDYSRFLKEADRLGCVGTLIWSLRPHSEKGGFMTHRENAGSKAYHAPGWPSPRHAMPNLQWHNEVWDEKEHSIIDEIHKASYTFNGERVPADYPIPNAPYVWVKRDDKVDCKSNSISWRGSAWAASYEIWFSAHPERRQEPGWKKIASDVLDAKLAGECDFQLPTGTNGTLMMRGMGADGCAGEWSNAIVI